MSYYNAYRGHGSVTVQSNGLYEQSNVGSDLYFTT
jgi:hypothetical protein